ncbi:VOC family protein [Actinomadura rubrisoli]|uniref:VOC family protein n=1 Tax=Actinomadura rubrisoli TaxID=2530368 RepID=A0A4R5CDQ9_9ACTN|nr:VOC family protein [Actinomadura rubrisoli]TDD98191.1 VOC family protein [Actinomadura rubrisoli]
MPEVSRYAVGAPCWLDLASPDVGASKEFYRGLFGWSSYTLTVDTFGDYEMFTLGGVQGPEVAAMQGLLDSTQQPSWTCYFSTGDAQECSRAVAAAGGQEQAEPRAVAHLGRMAQFADTRGADFGVWEPYEFPGAAVWDEPSALSWVELVAPDVGEARRFYGEVFGWTAVDRPYYRSGYTVWKVDDHPVAGMIPMDEFWPADHPTHWMPYFTVTDCDASAARAVELGARLRVPPSDVPSARFAVMNDPVGARLAIVTQSRVY